MQINLVILYFIYGLAFFSMGLAMTMEAGRSPRLAEASQLRPLAAFGIAHGIHEWLELFLLISHAGSFSLPAWIDSFRLGLLVFSFISLVGYGVQVFFRQRGVAAVDFYISLGWLGAYIILLALTRTTPWSDPAGWIASADGLARYMLAVPGGLFTALSLFLQARYESARQRFRLSQSLMWTGWGFGLYGLTQVFIQPSSLLPARLLNTIAFQAYFGFPIQLLRTTLAVITTLGLIRATTLVEKERQEQLADAQNARLEALELVQQELLQKEELRKQLLRHTVIAQEEERGRIARELHDETAQTLTAFSLDLATLKTRVEKHQEVTLLVDRLQDHCHQISQDLYRLVHDLRPAQLDDLGLLPALQHLVDELHGRAGMVVDLAIHGEERRLDPLVETVFFRVAQEAVTNVIKHAHTDHAQISIWFKPEQVQFLVKDEGVGFDTQRSSTSAQNGWGIAGMRERLASVGGQFELESSPGRGTRIHIVVPTDMIEPEVGRS